ncbi:MAG: HAMP domain-containing protein [Opitutae bacterium]|nr:HAMP domain-containing protein [Opitutae bacterium]
MKFFPKTLLGQTALYLGALLLTAQALWFATAQYFILTEVKPAYQQQIVDLVVLAQALVEAQPPDADLSSTATLRLASLQTAEIVPDSHPRPVLVPHDIDDVPGDLNQILRQRLGPSALSLQQKDAEISWLRFPARGQLFWLKASLSSTRTVSIAKALFISLELALAVGGAYLIVFRLTKKLHYVTEAAKAIGHGEPPATLEISGPEEIRSLCEGFNQMSRDLVKLEADRRLMLAGISHDLRTPLTRLRIAVELAQPNVEPAMVHDIEDMDAILKQFLDYARDGSEEPPAEHDLDTLVRETAQRFAARGRAIETGLGQVPPFVFRRHSIRRVLDNLIDNAVRYGKTGVRVQTRLVDGTVSVTVSDRGPGIRSGRPADFIQPFAREDAARSESGAGLGLAIVDRVIRLHGGHLRLENAPGGGLSATIELPFRPAATVR